MTEAERAEVKVLEDRIAYLEADRKEWHELHAAFLLVHQEARELVGEADATGMIPQANLNALRALLWRASVRQQIREAGS